MYMTIAETVAKQSSAKRLQVGAIIVKEDRVISLGYNGMPAGWTNECEYTIQHSDDTTSLKTKPEVIHAEANAILHAKEPLHGMTLYITMPPCASCSGLIIQSGISKIVFPAPTEDQLDRWGPSMSRARRMLEEAGVEIKQIDKV